MKNETDAETSIIKSSFHWLLDHKYITSVLYILFISVVLFLCQLLYQNIGSISSLTTEEFGSIVALNTSSVTPFAIFASSYFHLNMGHLLENVISYIILSFFVLLFIRSREWLRNKPMPPYYLLSLSVLTTLFVPMIISISTIGGWGNICAISITEVGFSGVVYSVSGVFVIEAVLLIGLLGYTYLVKPARTKYSFISPWCAIAGCMIVLWTILDAGEYILYNDIVGLNGGELINVFGHLGGFIFGVILALILEKLPEQENDTDDNGTGI